MTRPCAKTNLLVRSGMTQHARQRAELKVDHFLPDERELADLILFGQRFARHVQYYDAGNSADGDWRDFFESDVSASLAALGRLPVDAWRSCQLDLERWIKADPHRDTDQLAAHGQLLFFLPLSLLQLAARHHARLPKDHSLALAMLEQASRELVEPLGALAAWFKAGLPADPPDGNEVFLDDQLLLSRYNLDGTPADSRLRLSSTLAAALQPLDSTGLGELELAAPLCKALHPDGWPGLYAASSPDDGPWIDAIGHSHQRYEQLYDAISYNLLSSAVERIYQALERIRRDALQALQQSLQDFAAHPAHQGLWLSFLQLFRHAQGELNQFTARHLDFYFRQVLRLDNRAPQPDSVHVLFELAKGIDAHLLKAGTLLRAGKDASGKALSYALEQDLVVNRGHISELRGLQLLATGSAPNSGLLPLAAPMVRSLDGLGEVELPDDQPAWPAFGPAASPAARIGFSIGDRKLFLREGSRVIQIRALLHKPVSSTAISPRWKVRLSGEKGWFEPAASQISTRIDNFHHESSEDSLPARTGERDQPEWMQSRRKRKPATRYQHLLEISITLNAEDPAIIPLDLKLHGDDHPTGLPVAEVAFDFSHPASAAAFKVLRNVRLQALSLQTSASGLKQLSVLAGSGAADPAKPFAAFGSLPLKGSSLILGSSEIFSKSISQWNLTLDWAEAYDIDSHFRHVSASNYNPSEYVLSGGNWLPVRTKVRGRGRFRNRVRSILYPVDISLGDSNVTAELHGASLIDGRCAQTLDNPPLSTASVNGFVRLDLPRDFGHRIQPDINTRCLIDLASDATDAGYTRPNAYNFASSLPKKPYDPKIKRLEASYSTTRDRVERQELLCPFGLASASEDRLFPPLQVAGALLIGVADFEAPARLSLLVQVADGSGDPLKPAPQLAFHYLSGDRWQALEARDVDDRTRNFSSSGIIALNLPLQADRQHRLLPAGLHWLRISCSSDADAFNRLLSVDAQAARAVFVDAGNDPAHLETPLPAGSIGKLQTPDLAIKKVSQPWSSFGGRPRESNESFAVRVSERLRHKDRAISLWDYEALVLEAFPQLYRVKCLGTTELKRNAQQQIIGDNEQMPGAVTVVTVPWTHGHNSRDPLRPWTDQATLTAVDAFLRPRISPFVRLTVQNPKFEEVHLKFNVKFRPEIGDIAFHIQQVNQALIGFLTPWAQPGGGEITFGGRLWKSSIIDFVEELPEVDYVTDFHLYHKVEIGAAAGAWTPVDVELIETTTARSILVSAARHDIYEVPGHG